MARADIHVLPEDSLVLLVDADRVAKHDRLAAAVADDRVEVADLAEAIAPELERVGEGAELLLSEIEDALVVVLGARMAVRHGELGIRRPVQHPPLLPVVVAHVVEHEPLPGREAEPEPPLLPAKLVACQLEARTVRLLDLERLEIRARADTLGPVFTVVRRQRDGGAIVDAEHLHAIEIHERDEPLDRTRVARSSRLRAHEGQRADETAAELVLRVTPVPRGDCVDAYELEIGDPPSSQRAPVAGVSLQRLHHRGVLVRQNRWHCAGYLAPRDERLLAKGDDALPEHPGLRIEHGDRGLPVDVRLAA